MLRYKMPIVIVEKLFIILFNNFQYLLISNKKFIAN